MMNTTIAEMHDEENRIIDMIADPVIWLLSQRYRVMVNAAELIEDTRNKVTGKIDGYLVESLGDANKLMSATLSTGDIVLPTRDYRLMRLSAYVNGLKKEGIKEDIMIDIRDHPGESLGRAVYNTIEYRVKASRISRDSKLPGNAIAPRMAIETKGSLNEIEGNIKDAKEAIDKNNKTGMGFPASGLAGEINRANSNYVIMRIVVLTDGTGTATEKARMAKINDDVEMIKAAVGVKSSLNFMVDFCTRFDLMETINRAFCDLNRFAKATFGVDIIEKTSRKIERTEENKANDPDAIKRLSSYQQRNGNIDSLSDWRAIAGDYLNSLPRISVGEYLCRDEVKVSDDDIIF